MRQADDYQYSDICNQISRLNFTDDWIKWLQSRVCEDSQGSGMNNTWLKSLCHDTTVNNLDDCLLNLNSWILLFAATNKKRCEV